MSYFRLVSAAALTLICAACGGGSGGTESASVITLAKKVKLTPPSQTSPTPPPTPTQSPSASQTNFIQLNSIASNFDTAAELESQPVPGSMAPDEVGAFRMTCKASHNAYDDPIVFPGQPGASHLHTFFGNTLADAFSTYSSLRTTGESTCHTKLNRSAYWVPALMNGRGQVVMPDFLTVYYKRWPAGSTQCTQAGKCIPLPRGLRMVFGRKMTGPAAPGTPEAIAVHFDCQGPGSVPGTYPTFAEAAKNCPTGAQIGAINNAPQCWNGTDLDSADHRSHLAFFITDVNGVVRCPSTHPFVIPAFTLGAWYTTDDTLDRSGSNDPSVQTWYFASDRMAGMTPMPTGSTFHADWFGAWDDDALMAWSNNCIDKMLSCTTGNLGNGTAMKWLAGFNFLAEPRLVAPPIRLTTAMLCTGKRKLEPAQQEMVRAIRRKLDRARDGSTMLASNETRSGKTKFHAAFDARI